MTVHNESNNESENNNRRCMCFNIWQLNAINRYYGYCCLCRFFFFSFDSISLQTVIFFYIYTLAMLRWMLVFAAFLACSLFHFNKCQTYCIGISLSRWMHSMSWIRCVCVSLWKFVHWKSPVLWKIFGFLREIKFWLIFFTKLFFEQKFDLKNLRNKKIRSKILQFIRSKNS